MPKEESRVTWDDEEGRYVYEGFGPPNRSVAPDRRYLQTFMGRIARDVQDHPDEYGALRDPLILLAENYARTCQSGDELERRLFVDVGAGDERGTAAVLIRRLWRAQREADQAP
jgi:hypothetical protein